MKRLLCITASPRTNSYSSALAKICVNHLVDREVTVDTINLSKTNISFCRACYFCQQDFERLCCIPDDMTTIYHQVLSADYLLLATPVYSFSLPAQTKLLLDRFFPLANALRSRLSGKKLAVICCYGDKDPIDSGVVQVKQSLQHFSHYFQLELVEFYHKSEGGRPANCEQDPDIAHETLDLVNALTV